MNPTQENSNPAHPDERSVRTEVASGEDERIAMHLPSWDLVPPAEFVVRRRQMPSPAVPGAYAAWTSWCAAFARGDDLPMEHLVPINVDLGPDMMGRALRHVDEAFAARITLWGTQLNRDLGRQVSPVQLGSALNEARRRLRPLAALVRSHLLEQAVRVQFSKALTDFVTSAETQLERNFRANPRLERELLGVLRSSSLLSGLVTQSSSCGTTSGQSPTPGGRRVML